MREPVERCQLGVVTLLALASVTQHLGQQQGTSAKAGRLLEIKTVSVQTFFSLRFPEMKRICLQNVLPNSQNRLFRSL